MRQTHRVELLTDDDGPEVVALPIAADGTIDTRQALVRDGDRWEGTGVLVVASAAGIDAVRTALSSGCS